MACAVDAAAEAGADAGVADAGDVQANPADASTESAEAEAGSDEAGEDAAGWCVIPATAYTATPGGPTPAPPPFETPPTSLTVSVLGLLTNQLVYNPFDRLLYASVPSAQGPNGNSIAVIDPPTATVIKTVTIGSEPNALALSDDGAILWVGLDGASAVARYNVSKGLADLQFSLPQSTVGLDIGALPGSDWSVIVVQGPPGGGLGSMVIYDDGVPRSSTPGSATLTSVATTYDPRLVYGYDAETTGPKLFVGCVDGDGVFQQKMEYVFGSFAGSLVFAKGVLYGGDGTAFDIARETKLGTYDTSSLGKASVAPDPVTSRVFFLSNERQPVAVTAFDLTTFDPLGSETFHVSAPAASLVRWGRYGYAFRASNGPGNVSKPDSVVIARSTLVPPPSVSADL